MAATLKTLEILERDKVPEQLAARGQQLCEGLAALGEKYGHEFRITGPPAAPTVRFAAETNFERFQHYCAAAIEAGVFFHPHHNWFLCAAHSKADLAETLEKAERAFSVIN